MNRQEKRKLNKNFNKLPPEQQEAVIQHMLIEKISPVMNKEITKSIIAGTDLVWSELYEKFVSVYDATLDESEAKSIVENMMSVIRQQYLRIQTNKAKAESEAKADEV